MQEKIVPDESYLEGLDSLDAETESVTPEERAELENVLERMIIAPADRRYDPMPEKEDSRLPWFVLSGALLTVAVSVLIGLAGVDRSVSRLVLNPDVMSSGEGRVLERYRQESEERIRRKDAEILNILRQMDRLERQRQGLELLTRAAIEQREQQIREEAAAELARERAKLGTEGLSAQEADRRIQQLQAQLNSKSQEEMNRLKEEADIVLTVQREEIAARQDMAQTALIRVSRERTEIVTDLEVAMTSGSPGAAVEASPSDLNGEPPEPEDSELQQQDLMVSTGIAAAYEGVLSLIAQSRLDQAGGELEDLRSLLTDPGLDELPVAAVRRPSDIAMVEALEAYLAQLRRERVESGAASEVPQTVVEQTPPPIEVGPVVGRPDAAPTETPVGRVALADANRVVVETLSGFSVPSGAVLELWRTGTTDEPLWVAYALVVAVTGDRVVATIRDVPARDPRVFDLAYLRDGASRENR